MLTPCTGLGYQDHRNGKRNGARLLRVEKTDNFSVHDILLVDAPMFHFVMNTVTNGEAYNMVIRGGDWGGLDGVDPVVLGPPATFSCSGSRPRLRRPRPAR